MIGKKAIQKQLSKTLFEAIPLITTQEEALDLLVQIVRCEKSNLLNRDETEKMKDMVQDKFNELEAFV